MPIYEYECSNCKFYVEALQKISEPPMKQCPSCKKQTMKRLVSAPVFRLKGGGWYETDFKSDQEGKRNLAAGEDADSGSEPSKDADGDKKDTKADAQPAADAKADKSDKSDKSNKSSGKGRPPAKAAKPSAKAPAKKPAAKPKSRPRAKAPARKK
jgi:putative FmdB family regulatory protein